MHLIGGFTSSGKTQFMLNIIDIIISTTKVTLFSLEMSRVDIIARLLSIRTGIGASKILRHEFSEQWELDEYEIAKKRLVDSCLKIYSQTNLLDDIIMSMTRDIVMNKTKVFAIDYAQLVRTKSNNEYEQVSETAQRLQNFARENGVTIIVLSQISNEHAKDQNREVMGFKGGGTLPASADLAIELVNVDNREERAQKLMDKIPFSVNCIVRKNRHGRTGIINFDFSPWNGKFEQSLMN
jgi:replicative DNA helicase